MDRSNPYEAAFEAYLNEHGLCYIGVDEKKRSFLDEMPVKNLDFVVLGSGGARLLVDVKGRRFPGGPPEKQRRVWENWSTQEDIRGLTSWMRLFGPGYLGLFVFMYRIGPQENLAEDMGDLGLWTWHETRYRLAGGARRGLLPAHAQCAVRAGGRCRCRARCFAAWPGLFTASAGI